MSAQSNSTQCWSQQRGSTALIRLGRQCLAKLNEPRNVAKGGWDACHPMELLRLLEVEVKELRAALSHLSPNREDVISECADVANFAAMIADVIRSD